MFYVLAGWAHGQRGTVQWRIELLQRSLNYLEMHMTAGVVSEFCQTVSQLSQRLSDLSICDLPASTVCPISTVGSVMKRRDKVTPLSPSGLMSTCTSSYLP